MQLGVSKKNCSSNFSELFPTWAKVEKVPDGFLLEGRAISMMDLGHMFLKSDHVVGKKVARQLELPAQVFTVRIVPPSTEEATKRGKSISVSCPEEFILPGQGAEGCSAVHTCRTHGTFLGL